MLRSHNKFELAPRLRLSVGRGSHQNQILKIASLACLLIALGLAINAVKIVSKQHSRPNPQPEVLGATDNKAQNNQSQTEFVEYKVAKGDTLFNISQKFKISWTTIATLNNLKSPFIVKPGQTLKIPKE